VGERLTRKTGLLSRIFSEVVGEEQAKVISKGVDIIGDIAVIKSPPEMGDTNRRLGEALIRAMPYIKVVLRQSSPVQGAYRLRGFERLAGESRTETTHKEFGCTYVVDIAKTYFSPRLSTERNRVAEDVCKTSKAPSEVIINMFAGVGGFSILIAKKNRHVKVYSLDVNADAVRYMMLNIRKNKVSPQVTAGLGDAVKLIEESFSGWADRVLMPLPERAREYLPYALKALKADGGVIYYELFVHAGRGEDPVKKAEEETARLLQGLSPSLSGRVIRDVGPFWFQVAQDIRIGEAR